MRPKQKYRLSLFILLIALIPLLALEVSCGWQVYHLSQQRAKIKNDYSEVNNIKYGLLSVEAWRDHIEKIVSNQIEGFNLTAEQEKYLRAEISRVLNNLITQADSMLQQDNKTLIGKIRNVAVKNLVKENELRGKVVPQFTQTILNEINTPKNREKIKDIVEQKVKE